jgi:hypothetical protein
MSGPVMIIFIYVGLTFSYLEFVIEIGASCLLCEGPSVLDGLMWASRGHCDKCFLGDRSSVKSESLTQGVITMTLVGKLEDIPHLNDVFVVYVGSHADNVSLGWSCFMMTSEGVILF